MTDKRVKEKQQKIEKFLNENKGHEFTARQLSLHLRIDLTTIHRILKTIEKIKIKRKRNNAKRKPTKVYSTS